MGRVIEFPGASMAEPEVEPEFCIVNVELDGTEIWRELIVPADCRLDMFAQAVTMAFEWGGSHIWFFELPGKKVFYDDPAASGEIAAASGEQRFPATVATVAQLLPDTDTVARFVYDMGDNWEMTISLSDMLPASSYPFPIVPVCTDGAMAAPFEDVGGVSGWNRFCEAMENPDDPDYDDLLEWAGLDDGDDFFEEAFDPREVNELFAMDMVDGQQDTLPDDVDKLRDMVVALSAEILSYQTNEILTTGDVFTALDAMMQGFDADDLRSAFEDLFQ